MDKEDIKFVDTTLSLNMGDEIVDIPALNPEVVYKVVCINYHRRMVAILSENNITHIVSFNDVSVQYQRIVK